MGKDHLKQRQVAEAEGRVFEEEFNTLQPAGLKEAIRAIICDLAQNFFFEDATNEDLLVRASGT